MEEREDFVTGTDTSFQAAVEKLCMQDGRYAREAYYFLVEGLDFTVKQLEREKAGHGRHVTGKELAEGLKMYALKEFGALAFSVLEGWGVRSTHDFGQLVFNLIKAGKLGKTEQDKETDFDNRYDFRDVFLVPFLPENRKGQTKLLRELKKS